MGGKKKGRDGMVEQKAYACTCEMGERPVTDDVGVGGRKQRRKGKSEWHVLCRGQIVYKRNFQDTLYQKSEH